jgi:hypothetical protein
MFVSDNGMELTSIAILRWSQETRIEWHCAPTSSSNTSWFAALHEAAIGTKRRCPSRLRSSAAEAEADMFGI